MSICEINRKCYNMSNVISYIVAVLIALIVIRIELKLTGCLIRLFVGLLGIALVVGAVSGLMSLI